MQRKFLTWLFLLICAAFAVAGALAFMQFQRQARDRTAQIMSTRLHDLLELVTYTQSSMRHVMEINDASTLARTRALAEIIRLNPAIIDDQEALQGLCNDLGATQISVTDEQGVIIAAVPASFKGYDMASHEQSRPFLKCIQEPGYELCQRPRSNSVNGEIIQYAGVHRLDQNGIVQLGFTARHEQTVKDAATFGRLAANFKLGKNGHIIAFHDGALLNRDQLSFPTSDLLGLPIDKDGEISIADTDYFTYAVSKDGFRLVGLLPSSEMTDASVNALKRMLQSNVFLFIIEFILVWALLQKLVLSGLSRIDRSLRRITEGYKDERVDVKDNPEFTRLSTGINAMVDSLQAYAEQGQQRLKRELEFARAIQTTVLPNKFPAFPGHPEFDLYATCAQANVVGGDFYDFFMSGKRHVCFLVGDIADMGIPAALFMMRALSIIREMAHAARDLQELACKVNRSLCEGNAPGMRLSLFYGMLEIESGRLSFFNAGRPQALIQHEGEDFEMLAMQSGSAMGISPNAAYTACHIDLQPGDRLFLYTHGVLEATNADNTPFDAIRLQQALMQAAPAISDIPRNVRTALRSFVGDMDPNKDITMLAFEYKGKRRNKASLTFAAGKAEGVREMLDEQLQSVFASPLAIQDLQAAAHTLLAALPTDCMTTLSISCDEKEAELVFSYGQPRLNPLVSLPHLPVDHTEFSADPATGSTLKIWKKLE